MKIMFAECCCNLVVPNNEDNKPKSCKCGKSFVWWESVSTGNLALWTNSNTKPSVLGIHNGLLRENIDSNLIVTKDKMEQIIENTPDKYLFKRLSSLIVRMKPGMTGDIRIVSIKEADQFGLLD